MKNFTRFYGVKVAPRTLNPVIGVRSSVEPSFSLLHHAQLEPDHSQFHLSLHQIQSHRHQKDFIRRNNQPLQPRRSPPAKQNPHQLPRTTQNPIIKPPCNHQTTRRSRSRSAPLKHLAVKCKQTLLLPLSQSSNQLARKRPQTAALQ